MVDEVNPVIEFSAQDRCDFCGAQAYHLAKRADQPAELMFCNKHGRAHEPKLIEDGWTVISDSAGLETLYVNV